MEYSHQDIDRKFRDSIIKARIELSEGVSQVTYVYVDALEVDDDGVTKIYGRNAASLSTFNTPAIWRVSTVRAVTSKRPRLVPVYWNPECGLYYGWDDRLYLVTRQVKRAFCVGLNHNSYNIQLFTELGLGDRVTADRINPMKPRVFSHPRVYSEQIYQIANSLFFNNHRIGIKNENNIYLCDSDYVHFLPEQVKESCTISH